MRSAGAELEGQHQTTMQQAEAKIQQLMHKTSLRFQAVEKRAQETEDNLRRFQSTTSESENIFLAVGNNYKMC